MNFWVRFFDSLPYCDTSVVCCIDYPLEVVSLDFLRSCSLFSLAVVMMNILLAPYFFTVLARLLQYGHLFCTSE